MKSMFKPSAIAVGMFDGVHIGHRALLEHTVTLAKERGLQSVAYTFSNHPRGVFSSAPAMLMTADERREAIKSLGIELVCMDEFTHDTARLAPKAFVEALMVRFDAKLMLAGFNYTFGYHADGTADTLRELSAKFGFDAAIEPHVDYEGEPVSSTRIRACIKCGDVIGANAMLGSVYTLTGEVVRNMNIGTKLGFPTANIIPPNEKILLKPGVYATSALIDGIWRAAVTNIGDNPTVGGNKTTVETHIPGYSGDLYGKALSIRFHEYIRSERRFDSKGELAKQIKCDTDKAANIYSMWKENG